MKGSFLRCALYFENPMICESPSSLRCWWMVLSLLFRQLRAELLLFIRDEFFVALRIHKRIPTATLQQRIFLFHAEIATVGAEENVASQRLQNAPHALVVFGNLRILLVVNEPVPGIDVGTADDHNIVGLAGLSQLHRPAGASLRVSRSEVG